LCSRDIHLGSLGDWQKVASRFWWNIRVDSFFCFQLMRESYSRLMGLAGVSKNLVRYGARMRRHGQRKFAMKVTTAATLFASVLSSTFSAQTNAAASTPPSANRYLFIVETSRAMRPRANGVFDAMKRALDSSLNGQIHQGDLVGIWTFNEIVYQDLFPTQVWSQPTQLAFAVRLPTFADPELYQRRARLDKVVPEMLKVVAESDNLTIILVSTGEGLIEGMRFSAPINSAWKEWHDEQEGVHMPLLTVMRARNGQPTDWFLTPAPRPIEFPKLATVPVWGEQKEGNPAGVILESGLLTNPPAALAAEQQIAFSVWALGKTGTINSATSPQKLSTPQAEVPTNQLAGTAEIEPAKVTIAVPASTTISNAQSADSAKPVELIFVTNATVQPALVETRPPPTAPPPPPAASTADVPANHQPLLAHARAADPSQEEKHKLGPAMATPPRGFLRNNIMPLALMIVAGFGAIYCFNMWLRTNVRSKGNALSLTQSAPDEQVGQEP
jgi:hypothetical protein